MLLPLDSPHWNSLSACYSTPKAVEALREIVAAGRLGDAWDRLRAEILHQGSVYDVSSAALPHLIRLAPTLTADEQHDLWIEVGFLVTAGAGSFEEAEPVPGMQETLTQSLRDAETLALQSFLDAASLQDHEASYFALACVALAGHPVGNAMWEFLSPGEGYVRLVCPECEAEYEVDGFTDPLRAPCAPPPVPGLTPRGRPEWARVPIDLLPGFDAAARAVAGAGLPADAPADAVWCLVAAMVAAKGAVPWARTLLRLTGHFRCGECESVWPISAMLGDDPPPGIEAVNIDAVNIEAVDIEVADIDAVNIDADDVDAVHIDADDVEAVDADADDVDVDVDDIEAVDIEAVDADAVDVDAVHIDAVDVDAVHIDSVGGIDPAVIADEAGFKPAPGGAIIPGEFTLRPVAVPDGLRTPAPGEALVAVASELSEPAPGAAPGGLSEPAPGAAPGGLHEPAPGAAPGGLRIPVATEALVVMPDGRGGSQVRWLADLRDGRTVLAVGDASGTVRLCDPATRRPYGTLFERPGQPVTGMTFFQDLVVVYGDLTVDVWSPIAVSGKRSTMAPTPRNLRANGHSRIVAVAPGIDLGFRKPIVLADSDGTVSIWEPFGVRLSDPLPPDPAHHHGVVAVAASGGFVVTAGHASGNLRIWQPMSGKVSLIPLPFAPEWLEFRGLTLTAGHAGGAASFRVS
ncbi:MAG TPA: WD40 repeat domain-containing protein [Candidatus Limnocylindrales bacterium]